VASGRTPGAVCLEALGCVTAIAFGVSFLGVSFPGVDVSLMDTIKTLLADSEKQKAASPLSTSCRKGALSTTFFIVGDSKDGCGRLPCTPVYVTQALDNVLTALTQSMRFVHHLRP